MSWHGPRSERTAPLPAPGEGARPWVKVCGVTRVEDALVAASLGTQFLGLNFHPPSPRSLSLPSAVRIATAVRAAAEEAGRPAPFLAGVFVETPRRHIGDVAHAVGLDLVQLHGDPTPEDAAPFAGRALVVTRISATDPPSAEALTDRLASFPDAWGFLFDVRHDGLWGGSGESFGWEILARIDREALDHRPLFVAGGITPDNAARALAESGADGIDVASGVESAPGVKDAAAVERLLAAARRPAALAPPPTATPSRST